MPIGDRTRRKVPVTLAKKFGSRDQSPTDILNSTNGRVESSFLTWRLSISFDNNQRVLVYVTAQERELHGLISIFLRKVFFFWRIIHRRQPVDLLKLRVRARSFSLGSRINIYIGSFTFFFSSSYFHGFVSVEWQQKSERFTVREVSGKKLIYHRFIFLCLFSWYAFKLR